MSVFKTCILLFALQVLAAPADSHEAAKNGMMQLPLVPIPAAPRSNTACDTDPQLLTPVDNFAYDGPRAVTSVGIVLEVGTPPQKVIVEPDTGSSKLWLLGLPPGLAREHDVSTFFDAKNSHSLQDGMEEDGARYGASERINLNVVTDQVSFGGTPLGKVEFGVGNLDHEHTMLGRHVGVMGLLPHPTGDDFILDKLLNKKVVTSRAFSFSLRERGQGTLSFGGYDTSKFSGPLEKLAIQPSNSGHYIVEVQSVLFKRGPCNRTVVLDKQDVPGRPLTVGLDSGAPALQVSVTLAKTLEERTGGTFNGRFLQFKCHVIDAKASLEFKMSDRTVVSIPLLDFVSRRLDNGATCQLAVQWGSGHADLWIGRHFLRRSMVIYDPDYNNVYVARGADCGSSLVPIKGSMPDDVVVGRCKQEALDFDAPN